MNRNQRLWFGAIIVPALLGVWSLPGRAQTSWSDPPIVWEPVFGQLSAAQNGQESAPPSNTASGSTNPTTIPAQQSGGAVTQQELENPPGGKRVLGVLPNYRTADASLEGTRLTDKQKLNIALKDSFDYPLVLLAGAFAGLDQLTDSDPSFGQGVKGYAHRLGVWYADEAIGNMLAEGFYPMLLHQDPRYFRRGTGSVKSRTWYALTRVIVCHPDGSDAWQFNYSEWLGNATVVAISQTYHPDNRTALDATAFLFEQVGTDAVSQVLKEFWPDIKRKLFHRGANQDTATASLR
ncbi:MAG TPA: hypothetical protein VMG40_16340 [Bryobacteraceae bacterium]|nr:hypothetical protein [Bryobacteraceae bacterium]